ncbi:MAG: hypothetical protein HYT27_02195 [Parcubacteria group bacterium]|nr:hypothetical protein [Parcubacteria group bacterium]
MRVRFLPGGLETKEHRPRVGATFISRTGRNRRLEARVSAQSAGRRGGVASTYERSELVTCDRFLPEGLETKGFDTKVLGVFC